MRLKIQDLMDELPGRSSGASGGLVVALGDNMMTYGSSTKKWAVVTGAPSGIGKATALHLAASGSRVCCIDIVDTDPVVSLIRASVRLHLKGFYADD